MVSIPNNYPDGCTPDQIKTAIKNMQAELVRVKYDINSVLQFSPLINLGQFELERRQNEAVVKQSKVLGWISIGIALTALAISGLNIAGSSDWEQKQLTVLDGIAQNTAIAPMLAQQAEHLQAINEQLRNEIKCVLASPSTIQPGGA